MPQQHQALPEDWGVLPPSSGEHTPQVLAEAKGLLRDLDFCPTCLQGSHAIPLPAGQWQTAAAKQLSIILTSPNSRRKTLISPVWCLKPTAPAFRRRGQDGHEWASQTTWWTVSKRKITA